MSVFLHVKWQSKPRRAVPPLEQEESEYERCSLGREVRERHQETQARPTRLPKAKRYVHSTSVASCFNGASGQETSNVIQVPAKQIDTTPCKSSLKCFEAVGEEQRQRLFDGFWRTNDFSLQNSYISGCVKVIAVKRGDTLTLQQILVAIIRVFSMYIHTYVYI